MSEVVPVVSGELLPVCRQPGCGTVCRPAEDLCDGHAIAQRIAATHRRLVEAAPAAAEQLIDLALNATTQETRRRAAEAVLDRAGLRPGIVVQLNSSAARLDPAVLIRERLATLRARTEIEHEP